MDNQPTTLESVQLDFENWRSKRKKKGKIPAYLWKKAKPLINSYSISDICRALRLSGAQGRQMLLDEAPKIDNINSTFIEIDLPKDNLNATPVITANTSSVEIKRADGASMIIDKLNESAIATLLAKFIKDL